MLACVVIRAGGTASELPSRRTYRALRRSMCVLPAEPAQNPPKSTSFSRRMFLVWRNIPAVLLRFLAEQILAGRDDIEV